MSDPVQDLLDEQVAYYRARAAEFDRTTTPEPADAYDAFGRRARQALRDFAPTGAVIELAAGTGQWTGLLAEHANDLLVTDASPEMLALNRRKHRNRPNLTYRVVDAFALTPTRDRDVVMFGFFLSHVPVDRFVAFWTVVEGLLAPGGRVFFADEGRHFEWREDWIDEEAGIVRRTLEDDAIHRAVKVLWRPGELRRRLVEIGWDASVRAEGPFYWGTASRPSGR